MSIWSSGCGVMAMGPTYDVSRCRSAGRSGACRIFSPQTDQAGSSAALVLCEPGMDVPASDPLVTM
ncbi:MAG: hypothetical protein L0H31_00775, partial [Nocardioidaceae bacterium]|nr:hypothetical protein [Nocardioidaceae bacterium]